MRLFISNPVLLKDYICSFQFASKKWNLHASPKDPKGHTDIKYLYLDTDTSIYALS